MYMDGDWNISITELIIIYYFKFKAMNKSNESKLRNFLYMFTLT